MEAHCRDACPTLHGPVNFPGFGRLSPRPTILSDERVQHDHTLEQLPDTNAQGYAHSPEASTSQKCRGESRGHQAWHKHLQHREPLLTLSLPPCKGQPTLPVSLGKTKGHHEKRLLGRRCELYRLVNSHQEALGCWTSGRKPHAHQRVSCLKSLPEQGRKFMQSWRGLELAKWKVFQRSHDEMFSILQATKSSPSSLSDRPKAPPQNTDSHPRWWTLGRSPSPSCGTAGSCEALTVANSSVCASESPIRELGA